MTDHRIVTIRSISGLRFLGAALALGIASGAPLVSFPRQDEAPRPSPSPSEDPTRLKLCPECGETKAVGQFYRCAGRPDGRDGFCSECRRARMSNARIAQRPGERSKTCTCGRPKWELAKACRVCRAATRQGVPQTTPEPAPPPVTVTDDRPISEAWQIDPARLPSRVEDGLLTRDIELHPDLLTVSGGSVRVQVWELSCLQCARPHCLHTNYRHTAGCYVKRIPSAQRAVWPVIRCTHKGCGGNVVAELMYGPAVKAA